MLTLGPQVSIFLCLEPVDLRNGFDGLHAAALRLLARDPRQGGLFLFRNRRGDQLRALCFDRNGMAILAKRLDRGSFGWPREAPAGGASVQLTVTELGLLLAGLPLVVPGAPEPRVRQGA